MYELLSLFILPFPFLHPILSNPKKVFVLYQACILIIKPFESCRQTKLNKCFASLFKTRTVVCHITQKARRLVRLEKVKLVLVPTSMKNLFIMLSLPSTYEVLQFELSARLFYFFTTWYFIFSKAQKGTEHT